jgi:Domain of unknown function (DUF4258)
MSVTPAEALRDVQGFAQAGRIIITTHARRRMNQRGATYQDVRHALMMATGCDTGNEPETWKVTSADLDGDAMTLVVALDDGAIVITLYE